MDRDVRTTLQEAQEADPTSAQLVFFMHIAKTAGSYVNEVFENSLGPKKTATHVETFVGDRAKLDQLVKSGVRFVSGHIMYERWLKIAGESGKNFYTFSIMREPIEQLASHIQWLDHYNQRNFSKQFRNLDEHTKRLVLKIGETDITSAQGLDELLTFIEGPEVRMLDNCQARYFIKERASPEMLHRPLTLNECSDVKRATKDFDLIARQSDLTAAFKKLSADLGIQLRPLEFRVNASPSERKINTSIPMVRHVLSKRTTVDDWLWRSLDR